MTLTWLTLKITFRLSLDLCETVILSSHFELVPLLLQTSKFLISELVLHDAAQLDNILPYLITLKSKLHRA